MAFSSKYAETKFLNFASALVNLRYLLRSDLTSSDRIIIQGIVDTLITAQNDALYKNLVSSKNNVDDLVKILTTNFDQQKDTINTLIQEFNTKLKELSPQLNRHKAIRHFKNVLLAMPPRELPYLELTIVNDASIAIYSNAAFTPLPSILELYTGQCLAKSKQFSNNIESSFTPSNGHCMGAVMFWATKINQGQISNYQVMNTYTLYHQVRQNDIFLPDSRPRFLRLKNLMGLGGCDYKVDNSLELHGIARNLIHQISDSKIYFITKGSLIENQLGHHAIGIRRLVNSNTFEIFDPNKGLFSTTRPESAIKALSSLLYSYEQNAQERITEISMEICSVSNTEKSSLSNGAIVPLSDVSRLAKVAPLAPIYPHIQAMLHDMNTRESSPPHSGGFFSRKQPCNDRQGIIITTLKNLQDFIDSSPYAVDNKTLIFYWASRKNCTNTQLNNFEVMTQDKEGMKSLYRIWNHTQPSRELINQLKTRQESGYNYPMKW